MAFTQAELDAEINGNITTNGDGDITGATLRGTMLDMVSATFQGAPYSGFYELANGGLGGSQAGATAGTFPIFPGSDGAAVPSKTLPNGLTISASETGTSPSVNTKAFLGLLNTSNAYESGAQLLFGGTIANPFFTISSVLRSGPSPYYGDLVFATRNTTSGPNSNFLWLTNNEQTFSGSDPGGGGEVSGFYNFGAYNDKAYQCFIGYSHNANAPGGSAISGYFVADNDDATNTAGDGATAFYAEGRVSNIFAAFGAEIDVQNTSGNDPRVVSPYSLFGTGTAPLAYAFWSQPDGTKSISVHKDASAWAGVAGGASGTYFRKGIVFGSASIATVGGHMEAVNFASGHEIAWYDSGSDVGRLSSDAVTLNWSGAAAALTPVAYGSLPASPSLGMIACVNNSSVNTWGGTADGAGSDQVLVWYNGSAWTVIGK